MKVDFSKQFTDPFGAKISEETIGRQLAKSCFTASTVKGQQMTPEQKYMAFVLSGKLAAADEVEISTEEATLLKDIVNDFFNAGAYGQVVNIIEGK